MRRVASNSLTVSQPQLLTVFEIAGSARVSAESGSESLSGSSADASGMRPCPWRVAEDVRGGGTLNVKPETRNLGTLGDSRNPKALSFTVYRFSG